MVRVSQKDGAPAPRHVRQRLLQAARSLLSEGGEGAATARAICQLAGVRAPSLYHHFGDLGRLQSAAINAAFGDVMAEYRRESRAGDTVAAIRQAWAAFMAFARSQPRLARLFIARSLDGDVPETLRLTLWRLRKDLGTLRREGRLATEADVAASLLWTAAVGAVQMSASDADMTRVTDLLLNSVLEALIRNPE